MWANNVLTDRTPDFEAASPQVSTQSLPEEGDNTFKVSMRIVLVCVCDPGRGLFRSSTPDVHLEAYGCRNFVRYRRFMDNPHESHRTFIFLPRPLFFFHKTRQAKIQRYLYKRSSQAIAKSTREASPSRYRPQAAALRPRVKGKFSKKPPDFIPIRQLTRTGSNKDATPFKPHHSGKRVVLSTMAVSCRTAGLAAHT